jgi:catechol 2,3-dioxygenase-like lactoylglutathione lyase family enzyme
MTAHMSIGVRDIDRSKRFYDAALKPLGYNCVRAARTAAGYGCGAKTIAFWVMFAEHAIVPDEKSGLHVCFVAPSVAAVEAFHAAEYGLPCDPPVGSCNWRGRYHTWTCCAALNDFVGAREQGREKD